MNEKFAFSKQDHALVVAELERILSVKLQQLPKLPRILVDSQGKAYFIVGGTGNWHGISAKLIMQIESLAANMVLVIAKKYKTRIDLFVAPMSLLMAYKAKLIINNAGSHQFHTIATEDGLYLFEAHEVYLQKISEFTYGNTSIQRPFDVRTLLNLDVKTETNTPHVVDENFTHSDIEAKLIIMGGSLGFRTFTPDQSKASRYGLLHDLCSDREFPPDYLSTKQIKKMKNIDVFWFNQKGVPTHCFEVEHTTTITEGLVRLSQVLDLPAKLFVVSHDAMRNKFEVELDKYPFMEHKDRYSFRTYRELDHFLQLAKEFVMQRTHFLNENPTKWLAKLG